jgi:hypothetical protein
MSLLVSTLSLFLPLFVSQSEILMSVADLIFTDPPKIPPCCGFVSSLSFGGISIAHSTSFAGTVFRRFGNYWIGP